MTWRWGEGENLNTENWTMQNFRLPIALETFISLSFVLYICIEGLPMYGRIKEWVRYFYMHISSIMKQYSVICLSYTVLCKVWVGFGCSLSLQSSSWTRKLYLLQHIMDCAISFSFKLFPVFLISEVTAITLFHGECRGPSELISIQEQK